MAIHSIINWVTKGKVFQDTGIPKTVLDEAVASGAVRRKRVYGGEAVPGAPFTKLYNVDDLNKWLESCPDV